MPSHERNLHKHSHGRVLTPESYNYATYLPERGGLFCPRIFGPVSWARADVATIVRDERSDRWGHVELPGSERIVLVIPPAFRRFRLLSAREHRDTARARRAMLLALDASGDWPYCDPVDKLLAEEGLDDPASIEALEEGATEHPINERYRTLLNRTNSLSRLTELAAPGAVVEEALQRVVAALDMLRFESTRHALPAAVMGPLTESLERAAGGA